MIVAHLGGDSALNGIASLGDGILGEAQLWQRSTGGNLDLRCDNVNAGDLLSDGVLDLDSRVDLDKVVAVLLVYEELGLRDSNVREGITR